MYFNFVGRKQADICRRLCTESSWGPSLPVSRNTAGEGAPQRWALLSAPESQQELWGRAGSGNRGCPARPWGSPRAPDAAPRERNATPPTQPPGGGQVNWRRRRQSRAGFHPAVREVGGSASSRRGQEVPRESPISSVRSLHPRPNPLAPLWPSAGAAPSAPEQSPAKGSSTPYDSFPRPALLSVLHRPTWS